MKLIKLHICYCNMILLDMHTTAYIAIIHCLCDNMSYITNVKYKNKKVGLKKSV